ncbi:type I 3-dehydroquinate dehydratase [Spirochaeta thermophila]|uniref:Shikimate dehydrogenase (NADP(+)) n=1 Tax=Winmispira thermophila (strain ATCC 49972 / DSM 6192 / RI 19.B1) TaxID=665571 RepID=E0RP76_WINT6|nr:type I 3-dehydroquinate dehydratase [Spirochaeta thermophila]ADN01270.1 3-dehydroquinate dehydratase, type 1 [Spirochaeta thermophila DSM 6192]
MRGGVCLSLTGRTRKEAETQLARWREEVDLLEVRADCMDEGEWEGLGEWASGLGLPAILTLRSDRDGGFFEGTEDVHDEALGELIRQGGWAYVDVEAWAADWLVDEARRRGMYVIRSRHVMDGVPEDLEDWMVETVGQGLVPKAACMLGGTEDLLRLVRLHRRLTARGLPPGSYILLGMGPYGVPTRILSLAWGSLLTFTSDPGRTAAPGHLDPGVMADLYRVRELSESTVLFGVIGNPVLHSRSPHLHNPVYRREGMDAVYLPIQVDELASFMDLADELPLQGLSVTIPHKEGVIPFLTVCDPVVQAVGSCNTMVRRDGGWFGTSTDVEGFLRPLREEIARGGDPVMKAAVVLGAGGAARAVVYGLVQEGFRVLVLNRTEERARVLAGEFGVDWGALSPESAERMREFRGLIVQTTSVGMEGKEPASPVPWYRFEGDEICYDIVYTPRITPFLEAARRAGCRIITGDRMLEAQAEEQMRLFAARYRELRG